MLSLAFALRLTVRFEGSKKFTPEMFIRDSLVLVVVLLVLFGLALLALFSWVLR